MGKTTIGTKVDDELKAKLTELVAKNGKTVSQVLNELVDGYLDNHDKPRKRAHTAIEKVDEKVKDALCPFCDAPLVYSKGWWDDAIKCSFSKCDTHSKVSLKEKLGGFEYFRLLNLRRRAFTEQALKDQEKKEARPWWDVDV